MLWVYWSTCPRIVVNSFILSALILPWWGSEINFLLRWSKGLTLFIMGPVCWWARTGPCQHRGVFLEVHQSFDSFGSFKDCYSCWWWPDAPQVTCHQINYENWCAPILHQSEQTRSPFRKYMPFDITSIRQTKCAPGICGLTLSQSTNRSNEIILLQFYLHIDHQDDGWTMEYDSRIFL